MLQDLEELTGGEEIQVSLEGPSSVKRSSQIPRLEVMKTWNQVVPGEGDPEEIREQVLRKALAFGECGEKLSEDGQPRSSVPLFFLPFF